MVVDIYISERKGSREIRIPWLPEKIEFEDGGTIRATYDIMDLGPVEVPTGSGLSSYSWEGIFPGENRTDDAMMRGSWKAPKKYHSILEDWKEKGAPLRLLVTGYPINKDVILDEYSGSAVGGFGDIEYNISFIEDRDISVKSTKVAVAAPVKRSTPEKETYEIKPGDCLWNIAKAKYGSGLEWEKLYNENKEIIESTAKKYGNPHSNNGWWVYAGTVLRLP